MLCAAAAAVRAAAVAGWLLAVLGPALSLSAEDNWEAASSRCGHCFYRQTPPRGASLPPPPPLQHLCHSLPRGRAFATLYSPTCDTAVYSAFHLSPEWPERGGDGEGEEEEEEGGELLTENNSDIGVLTPALLRGDEGASQTPPAADSPLRLWDSSVAALLRSSIIPQCNAVGGDLYIVTGIELPGAAEGGDGECEAGLLWSAACCDVASGEGAFSVGLVRESQDGPKVVTVNELENTLKVSELFDEGCRGTAGEAAGGTLIGDAGPEITADVALPGNLPAGGSDPPEKVESTDADAKHSDKDVGDETEAEMTERQASLEPQVESPSPTGEQEASGGSARSEAGRLSDDGDPVAAAEADSNSTLIFIISTTASLLTAPLQPVVSTITKLPRQVIYVLEEHAGVLSSLPGDTLSLLHLLTSDLASWLGSAADMLLDLGEAGFSRMYHCTSSMLGELLVSCQTGVTGVGTLASDTVGIVGGAVDHAWWVTRLLGGRLWEQSGGYVGTVVSEMGGQVKAVGGGLGKLAWRSGNGVGNVLSLTLSLITGTVEMTADTVREAFGQESE